MEERLSSRLRWVAAVFVVAIALVFANAAFLNDDLETLRENRALALDTFRLVEATERVISSVREAESNQRGYLVTGDDWYLQRFAAVESEITSNLANLRTQADNDHERTADVAAVVDLVAFRLDRLRQGSEIRSKQGLEAAVAFTKRGKGREAMETLRETIARMQLNERSRLERRLERTEESSTSARRSLITQTAINVLLALLCYVLIRRVLRAQAATLAEQRDEAWLANSLADLSTALQGDHSLRAICERALAFFGKAIDAHVGAIYLARGGHFQLQGVFGADQGTLPQEIALGQGLAGEAARQRRVTYIKDLAASHIKVTSALGESQPRELLELPLEFEGRIFGVIELATASSFTAVAIKLADDARTKLAISLASAESRDRLQALLEETQHQAEELQTQQEELRVSNEELESQAKALEEQRNILQERNSELESLRLELESKAKALQDASRYKSEFLANMSHELRTPLNSLLLLATMLEENTGGNLTPKQVEFATTIRRSGRDLLDLISDVLDLAKVEAGRLDIMSEAVEIEDLLAELDRSFAPVAKQRGLDLVLQRQPPAPVQIMTDRQRVLQILRNLVGNALKFTENGSVSVNFELVNRRRDDADGGFVAFRVIDTGIGIAKDQLLAIFEAFQQGDGSTSRRFGGTGLGLTISRELATRLGGEITVESNPGLGSEFSLLLPAVLPQHETIARDREPDAAIKSSGFGRAHHQFNEERTSHEAQPSTSNLPLTLRNLIAEARTAERSVLIVEDDAAFAKELSKVARERNFSPIIVQDGEMALRVTNEIVPTAILLDVKLPGMSGLALLERIKRNPRTRHVPTHLISGIDFAKKALSFGAVGYLLKPVTVEQLRMAFNRIEDVVDRKVRRVLVVEDDLAQRQAICELIGGQDVETVGAGSAADAVRLLANDTFDCMVLDLRLPDMSGTALLERLAVDETVSRPPVVIYTGQDLTRDDESRLRRFSDSIVIKGARSPERLREEIDLFMHRVGARAITSNNIAAPSRSMSDDFEDRKVLLVDDDMRNVFALTNVLEAHGLKVQVARNGREAIEALEQHEGIDLVLMDIMMPVMDGLAAMQAIRARPQWRDLPIIALTAKAMKGDQERCFEAGASDYLPKPVDINALLSVLRVWLGGGEV